MAGWLVAQQTSSVNTEYSCHSQKGSHERAQSRKQLQKRDDVVFCIKVDRNCMKFLSPDLPCFHFLMHAHFNFFQHVIFVIRWYRLFVVTWHQFRQSHLKIPAGSLLMIINKQSNKHILMLLASLSLMVFQNCVEGKGQFCQLARGVRGKLGPTLNRFQ